MKNNILTLRIFSGVHLGAEISLPEGTYIIGKDDSADIILNDSSINTRHIQLSVSPRKADAESNDGKVEVRVTNLDSFLIYLGAKVEDGSVLEAGKPYYIGQTCFAFSDFGLINNVIELVSSELQNKLPTAGITNSVVNEGGEAFANKDDNDVALGANSIGGEQADHESNLAKLKEKQAKRKSRFEKFVVILMVIILIAAFSITINDTYISNDNNLDILKKNVSEAGFAHIEIVEKNGELRLQGIVKDDQERLELLKMAQSLHFPVYLDVEVQDDLANAIKSAYNGQGFYPYVNFDESKNEVKISSYLKDELTLVYIQKYIDDNLPSIKKRNVVYEVLFAKDMQNILAPLINKADLGFIQLQYLPGTISVKGDLKSEQKAQIGKIFESISLEQNIPLIVDILPLSTNLLANINKVNEPVQSISNSNQTINENVGSDMGGNVLNLYDQQGFEQSNDVSDFSFLNTQTFSQGSDLQVQQSNLITDFSVTSVTLEPIRFVVINSGQRVFEGGVLPGGYTLMNINMQELILDKNGIKTTYRLK